MRLLHTSKLQPKTFFGDDIPPYAILSHTWGEDELLYEDLRAGLLEPIANPKQGLLWLFGAFSIGRQLSNPKRGLRKVLKTCEVAQQLGLEWVWVDTCCIDKSSSAELSEAITSMFTWYIKSSVCLAFLQGVVIEPDGTFPGLEKSRWLTRGWTLQELIAPNHLLFFDSNWNYLASSGQIRKRLASATGIKEALLDRCSSTIPDLSKPRLCRCGTAGSVSFLLERESVVTKMKWAAARRTTREEDLAYCLMGIFDVNMPLLYGEGAVKAFQRLQCQIIDTTEDQSILLFHDPRDSEESTDASGRTTTSLLAEHPSWFSQNGSIERNRQPGRAAFSASRGRITVEAFLVPCEVSITYKRSKPGDCSSFTDGLTDRDLYLVILNCHIDGDVRKRPGFLCATGGWREFRAMSVVLSVGSRDKPEIVGGPGAFTNGGAARYVPETVIVNLKGQRFLLRRSSSDEPFFLEICSPDERLRVEGVLCFWREDPPSGFFVLWGSKMSTRLFFNKPYLGQMFSWVESWESFTGLKQFSADVAASFTEPSRLEELARRYAVNRAARGGSQAEDFGLDVQVETRVEWAYILDAPVCSLIVEAEWRSEMSLGETFMSHD